MLTLTTPASSGGNYADAPSINVRVANVLEILHARTGVEFATYRPATLERRIARLLESNRAGLRRKVGA